MRPDLKALDSGILAKEADVRASRAELFHQVGLLGQFAYSRAAGRDTINNPYVGDYFNALTIGAALGIRQNLSFWNVIARTNKEELSWTRSASSARARCRASASRWRPRRRT